MSKNDKEKNKGESTERKLDQTDIARLKESQAPDFGINDPEAMEKAQLVAARETAIKKAQKDAADLEKEEKDADAIRARAELDLESKKHVKMHKHGEHIKVHPTTVAEHEALGWQLAV